MLKNTRQHLFNSSKGWPLNNPFGPSPSGQGAHHFSRLLDLAVGGVGLAWAWAGVAGRWARRHAAPAVVGRFIFFRDLAFFGDSERSGFGLHGRRTTDDDETGLPPLNPLVLRTENRQIFIANFFSKKFWRQIFFGDFKYHPLS